MKRIEFVGVAGTGKSSIIRAIQVDPSLCIKYEEMRALLVKRKTKKRQPVAFQSPSKY